MHESYKEAKLVNNKTTRIKKYNSSVSKSKAKIIKSEVEEKISVMIYRILK